MAELPFVDRESQKERFKAFLESEEGECLLVIGREGVGKTRLLREFQRITEDEKDTSHISTFYTLGLSDESADPSIEFIRIEKEIGKDAEKKNFKSYTPHLIDYLRCLVKAIAPTEEMITSIPPEKLVGLIGQKGIRLDRYDIVVSFTRSLESIANALQGRNRFVLFFDPEKYIQNKSVREILVDLVPRLSPRIKIVIALRNDDALAKNRRFKTYPNLSIIRGIRPLEKESVAELLRKIFGEANVTDKIVDEFYEKYSGYPISIEAAIKLARTGDMGLKRSIKELPESLEELMRSLYSDLCKNAESLQLIKILSALYEPVSMKLLSVLSGLKMADLEVTLYQQDVLNVVDIIEERGIRKCRLFHQMFKQHVIKEMEINNEDIRPYHRKAGECYLQFLQSEDESTRLSASIYSPRHFLEAGMKKKYVEVVEETFPFKYKYGMLRVAEQELSNAIQFSEELKLPERRRSHLINNIGLIFQLKGDLKRALRCFNQALRLDRQSGYLAGQAIRLNNIGLIYQMEGKLDRALKFYKEALRINKQYGFLRGQAADLNNVGLIYQTQGDLDKALKFYKRAFEIDREIGYLQGQSMRLNNIGLVYEKQNDFERALKFFEKALEINRKIGYQHGIATNLANIGVIRRHLGDLENALDCHKKALEINEKTEYLRGIATNCNNMGLIYRELGRLDHSIDAYKRSLEINKEIGYIEGQVSDLNNIGSIYKEKGEKDEALKYFDEATKLSREGKAFIPREETYVGGIKVKKEQAKP